MVNLFSVKATRANLRGAVTLPPQLVVPKAWFDSAQNFTGASWQSRVGSYTAQQPVPAKQFQLIDVGLRVVPGTYMDIAAPFDLTATAAFTVLYKFVTISPEATNAVSFYFNATCDGDPGAQFRVYTFNNSLEGLYSSTNGPRTSLNSNAGIATNSSAWAAADFAVGRTNAARIFLNNNQSGNYPYSAGVAGLMDTMQLQLGNSNPDGVAVFAFRHMLVFDQLLTGAERQNWMDYLN